MLSSYSASMRSIFLLVTSAVIAAKPMKDKKKKRPKPNLGSQVNPGGYYDPCADKMGNFFEKEVKERMFGMDFSNPDDYKDEAFGTNFMYFGPESYFEGSGSGDGFEGSGAPEHVYEVCRKELYCRLDKSKTECCTKSYDEYMDWYTKGNDKQFTCPNNRVTSTVKREYCAVDNQRKRCCSKNPSFLDTPITNCAAVVNVNGDGWKKGTAFIDAQGPSFDYEKGDFAYEVDINGEKFDFYDYTVDDQPIVWSDGDQDEYEAEIQKLGEVNLNCRMDNEFKRCCLDSDEEFLASFNDPDWKCPKRENIMGFLAKYRKFIIIAVVAVIAVVIISIACCIFCCVGSCMQCCNCRNHDPEKIVVQVGGATVNTPTNIKL